MSARFELSQFLQTFLTEARERLGRIEQGVVRLERESANQELIDDLLRDAHTLKGSARMIGLMKVDEVAHRLEEVIGAVRGAGEPPSRAVIDAMLEAADVLKALVEEAGGGPSAPDAAELMKRMARWAGRPVAASSRAAEPGGPAPTAAATGGSRAERLSGLEHTIRIEVAKLEKLSNLSLDLVSACEQTKRLDEKLDHATQEMRRVGRALAELAVRLDGAERSPGRAAAIARDLAAAAARQREVAVGLGGARESFQSDAHRSSLATEELRELVVDVYMLPVSVVFDAFPRTLRELASEYDKEVQFHIEGGEVKLDKKIIEEIGEPMLHLLRNAVAHGVEMPQQREEAGKSRCGTIEISAATRADRILITVRDDGAGFDVEALKAKALERGLIEQDAAQRLSHEQALALAFLPGLTTSTTITDISGRGVGMDVVRAVVRRLNGTVEISSRLGAGSTVSLELPLTLAMMHVLLVRAGGHDMAMPSSFVDAVLKVSDEDDLPRSLIHKGDTLPVVSLAALMQLAPSNGNGKGYRGVVAIQTAGEKMGLAADEVLDEREIILRPLGPHLSGQRKVMAATLLSEGQVVPVLDIPGLVEATRTYQPQAVAAPPAAPQTAAAILLVEDSVVTADLERTLLEGAGYEVMVAGDGLAALAHLAEREFDLVVADLEMPRMDGFALLERLRENPRYAKLPVVVVTTRQSLEDKRRGLALGANAYITKGTFDQNVLLDTIERLIG